MRTVKLYARLAGSLLVLLAVVEFFAEARSSGGHSGAWIAMAVIGIGLLMVRFEQPAGAMDDANAAPPKAE
jgi:hypothetical protein